MDGLDLLVFFALQVLLSPARHDDSLCFYRVGELGLNESVMERVNHLENKTG